MYTLNPPLLRPMHGHHTQYSKDTFENAVKEVQAGKALRRTALEFGIPKSTLYDRVSGKVSLDCRSGPQRYLSDNEESEVFRGMCKFGLWT